jgi:multidrug efflux system outer membrane protein
MQRILTRTAVSGTSSRRPAAAARAITAILPVYIALAMAGCATPILQPAIEVPAGYAASSGSGTAPEVDWWECFGDPVLSGLVRRAALENRDVRMAAERVRAARAGEAMSRSWLLPGVDGVGYTGTVRRGLPDVSAEVAALGVSWEVDLAGRLRAGAAAAGADTIATENAARGVRLLVLTDVAAYYFTLAGAMRQLEAVREISAAQDETWRLVVARQRVGLASPFDVERAESQAESARAAVPPLETLVAVSRHRIAVLIGDQASNANRVMPWSGLAVVPDVHPGQPAALLQRRPDLLESHARLDAANWRRQQAAAEWFPRLFVAALFGHQDVEEANVDLESARFGNAAGLLTLPIVTWGRTRAVNDVAESAQVEAVLRYEDGIVRALEDVENALVALRDERHREAALQRAAAAADAALRRARSLYHRGQIDLLPLLDAQRTALVVRVSAIDSNTRLLLSAVRLFKALGGGWESFEASTASIVMSEQRPHDAPRIARSGKERT